MLDQAGHTYINISSHLNDNDNENEKQVKGAGDNCELFSDYYSEISVSKQDKPKLCVRNTLLYL